MKMRNIEIAVGAFMIAGIASLLMLALQVGGLSDFFQDHSGFKVQAEFSNIGGLKVRAKVSMAGVAIGRVTDITLNPEDYAAVVTLSIDPKYRNIPVDSQASILTAGLLGDNYIGIEPGFNDEEFLIDGSRITLENTHHAVVLEQLLSKFVTGQATQ